MGIYGFALLFIAVASSNPVLADECEMNELKPAQVQQVTYPIMSVGTVEITEKNSVIWFKGISPQYVSTNRSKNMF